METTGTSVCVATELSLGMNQRHEHARAIIGIRTGGILRLAFCVNSKPVNALSLTLEFLVLLLKVERTKEASGELSNSATFPLRSLVGVGSKNSNLTTQMGHELTFVGTNRHCFRNGFLRSWTAHTDPAAVRSSRSRTAKCLNDGLLARNIFQFWVAVFLWSLQLFGSVDFFRSLRPVERIYN